MDSSISKIVVILTTFLFVSAYAFSPAETLTTNLEKIQYSKDQFLKPKIIKKTMIMTITGYSSSEDETDETPLITAYNTYTREGIAASNILPFGTKIRIPSLFGDKIFIIEDKMNPRYKENLDIWFNSKEEALDFGIHYDVLVEILE